MSTFVGLGRRTTTGSTGSGFFGGSSGSIGGGAMEMDVAAVGSEIFAEFAVVVGRGAILSTLALRPRASFLLTGLPPNIRRKSAANPAHKPVAATDAAVPA